MARSDCGAMPVCARFYGISARRSRSVDSSAGAVRAEL